MLAALALVQSPQAAPTVEAVPPRPVLWVRRPAPEYPARATANRVTRGRVVLRCDIDETGVTSGCELESETPPGQHFGPAALAAMRRAQAEPVARHGVEVVLGFVSQED